MSAIAATAAGVDDEGEREVRECKIVVLDAEAATRAKEVEQLQRRDVVPWRQA